MWVTLRTRARLKGFELRRGQVVAFPNRFGDIAKLDILDLRNGWEELPCAAEISQGADLEQTVMRLSGLPRSRPIPVSVETSEASTGVFVRLARDEPTRFIYDILGDASENVEYTYDGRMLGIRLVTPLQGSGILIPRRVIPRYEEVEDQLGLSGFHLNDLRPYLESIGPVSIGRSRDSVQPAGVKARFESVLWEKDLQAITSDVHGDGRAQITRAPSGELIRASFSDIARGVSLNGIPERGDLEPAFRHHGVPILD